VSIPERVRHAMQPKDEKGAVPTQVKKRLFNPQVVKRKKSIVREIESLVYGGKNTRKGAFGTCEIWEEY